METQHDIAKKGTRSQLTAVVAWALVVGWMTIIFLLSSRQSISVSSEYLLNFIFFKFLHIVEYGILYVLILRALYAHQGMVHRKNIFLLAFFLTMVYAVSDELHQTYVPTREGKVRDVIIDGIGAGIIWYFIRIQLPKAPKRLKHWAHVWGLTY